jgi:hypothetical protein
MDHPDAYRYLRSISSAPDLYDAWAEINAALFDDALRPLPIIVGLTGYGRFSATCAMDAITVQPSVYQSGAWHGVMVHEMAHQADHQDGLVYVPGSRTGNVHNSTVWCDRINGLMDRLGDRRWAAPYRRRADGSYVANPAPTGRTLIPLEGLKTWEPTTESLRTLGLV